LLLAYGMALLVATGANVLGIIAILRNGVTIDRKWSSIVSATTGIITYELLGLVIKRSSNIISLIE
jgi:hypothetical protein